MLKLIIGNSTSRVEGLTPLQFRDLREVLSYKTSPNAAYFSSDRTGGKRYLISKRGEFGTGLMPYVRKWAEQNKLSLTVESTRIKPPAGNLFTLRLGVTPYPEQVQAAKVAATSNRGTISAPTGSGKSVMMALLIYELQVPTLIVVPNLGLKQQLSECFFKYFGSLNHITIENVGSPRLDVAKDYGCLLIDEAHHVAAKTYRKLNAKRWNTIFHRYFFTATPFRSRDEEQLLMESIAGQVIYRLDYKTCVAKDYVCPIEAYYYDLPKQEMQGNETSWPAVYWELVVNNDYRNEIIANALRRLSADKSVLTLVKEVAHGEFLATLTGVPFAKGENDDNKEVIERFNKGGTGLIGTTGILGEGVDTKPAEWIIIAGGGKSKNAFMQQVGRGFRTFPGKESCKVILFRDASHKWLLQHFNAQVKYLREEYGIKPVKLSLDY